MKTRLFAAASLAVLLTGGLFAQDPGYKVETRRPAPQVTEPIRDDSATSAAKINSMEVLDDSRPLQIGDTISLRVVEDRDKVQSLLIQESGDIQAPHIGLVKAAGRTCKQLAYSMQKDLEKQYFQQATVIVALERSVRTHAIREPLPSTDAFTIYGQVARQGKYELLPDEGLTVSQAILRAGGFAQFANKNKVLLIRKVGKDKSVTIQLNMTDVMEKGKLEKDIPMRPYDVIIVKEKLFNF
jgi:protein involved in polysaccharide export with SLBB domain